MIKRFFIISICVIFFSVLFAVSFSAENTVPRLYDECGFFTEDEYSEVLDYLDSKSKSDNCDYVAVFVPYLPSSYGDDIVSFADDFFDDNGFGRGDFGNDGILLLVVSELGSNGRYISTCGRLIDAINDDDIYAIGSSVKSNGLLSGDYVNAVKTFADESSYRLSLYDSGYYDNDDGYEDDPVKSVGIVALLSSLPSLLIAFISTGSMKSKLQTVSIAGNADLYVDDSSLKLSASGDTFLYSNTSRIRLVTESNSRSSGGGHHSSGSSHTSSSGRSHGGGRF